MRGMRLGRGVRLAAMAGVLIAGVLGALVVAQPPPPPPPAEMPAVEIRVGGEVLPGGGDAIGDALDLVRRYARGTMKLRLPTGKEVELQRADLGLTIDRARLAEFVTAALAPDGAVRRAHVARNPGAPLDVPLPLAIDEKKAVARLLDLKADSDVPPQDARIDLEARKVQPEIVGHRIDVYGSLARIEEALRDGRDMVDLEVEHDVPKVLSASLAGVKFDHVLGWFETRYTPGKKYEDRTFNLRLAASKLDGRVIMPGEVFDFNEVVGPRDEANGYRVAKVIAQGELVDGLGGGTCQISGTLHAAVFFAGLQVVSRYPHSRPSTYIKMGLDATVAYPSITYKFRNDFDFPIVLHEKVAGGVVRAEILGPERKQTVSYFRRIDEILPFEEVERETDKLPKGERVVTQRGIPGFRATSSRVVRDGAYAERTKWGEKYPPTNQIVAVGTGPDDMKPRLVEDNHPEYTVDEVLVMTQGPGIRTPGAPTDERGGGMIEQRTPGKTGEEGWIEKLGLAKTRITTDGDGPAADGPPDEGAARSSDGEAKGRDEKVDDKKGDKKKPAKDGASKDEGKKKDKEKAKKSAKKRKEGEG